MGRYCPFCRSVGFALGGFTRGGFIGGFTLNLNQSQRFGSTLTRYVDALFHERPSSPLNFDGVGLTHCPRPGVEAEEQIALMTDRSCCSTTVDVDPAEAKTLH